MTEPRHYVRKHYKPTRWDVRGPHNELIASFDTFKGAYVHADLLNQAGTSPVSIAPATSPALESHEEKTS